MFNYSEIQKRLNFLQKKLKNRRIALYGGGTLADFLFKNFDLANDFNIKLIADKNFKTSDNALFNDIKATLPVFLKEADIDIILVLSNNFEAIEDYLEDEILINCKNSNIKIIPFFN